MSHRYCLRALLFIGSFLLFWLQPLVARLLLPQFGGTPLVWSGSMVFFQTLLLLGYGWAYCITSPGRSPRWPMVHAMLLLASFVTLPVGAMLTGSVALDAPILALLAELTWGAGLPFFLLATGTPLLIQWVSDDDGEEAAPHRLYALSNVASLAALLAYPFVIESLLPLSTQRRVWSVLFAGYAIAVIVGLLSRRRVAVARWKTAPPSEGSSIPSRRRVTTGEFGGWAVRGAVPSALMLGVTTHLSSNVIVMPLFWVLPLAIYLLTYAIAFGGSRSPSRSVLHATVVIAAIGLVVIELPGMRPPLYAVVAAHLGVLWIASYACHAIIASTRPSRDAVTTWLVAIALGGAAGGVFAGVIAPQLFSSILEYPLALGAALFLTSPRERGIASVGVDFLVALALLAAPLLGGKSIHGHEVIRHERSPFGIHRVVRDPRGEVVSYLQGKTRHGMQVVSDHAMPAGYFHDASGIGELFRLLRDDERLDRIAAIGLGPGTVAARAEPRSEVTFFEVDPVVVDIARDPTLFTYLSDARRPAEIVVGDGRTALLDRRDGEFGLLVLDAVSSSSLPVHLVTVEAFDLYFQKLSPRGLVIVNGASRRIDMEPLLAAIASMRGWVALCWEGDLSPRDLSVGALPARWLLVARDEESVSRLLKEGGWRRLVPRPDVAAWTDDHASLIPVLRWR